MQVGHGFGKYILFDAIIRDIIWFYHHWAWVYLLSSMSTSEMQFCMLWTEASIWSRWQELYSWVLSAIDLLEMECCQVGVIRGFVYKMNKMGPRTEPCGMPKLSMDGCEKLENLLLIITVWALFEKGRIWTSWEVHQKFYRCVQAFERVYCDQWCQTQLKDQEELKIKEKRHRRPKHEKRYSSAWERLFQYYVLGGRRTEIRGKGY